jgi:hypothetical protein
VGAELLHADGQTKLVAAFRNYANAPRSVKTLVAGFQFLSYVRIFS